jgi:hypothetical protein
MMRKPAIQVMTANRLSDGMVLYLAQNGQWVEQLAAARFAKTDSAVEQLQVAADAAVQDRLVIGPYLFTVEAVDGGFRPISQREHIRALGPTVGTDMPVAPSGV